MPACSIGTFHGPIAARQSHGYARADCKRLTCSHCGPRKAARYRKRVSQLAIERQMQRFVTLTLDPAKIPLNWKARPPKPRKPKTADVWSTSIEDYLKKEGYPVQQQTSADDPGATSPATAPKFGDEPRIEYIRDCWAKMRVYLGRKYPNLKFIAVLELQKATGRAHLHILVSSFIPKEWLKQAWGACGGGWTDIKFVDVHRISAYMSKYLTKEILLGIPKGKRRITTSRDLQLSTPPQNSGWKRSHADIERFFPTEHWKIALVEDCKIDQHGLLYFEILPGSAGQIDLLDHSPPEHQIQEQAA